jgi:glutathione S-transferase
MADLILTTFDWVREMPRGYVRDMRVPWALKEAGSRYRVESAHFVTRNYWHSIRNEKYSTLWPGAAVDR